MADYVDHDHGLVILSFVAMLFFFHIATHYIVKNVAS